MKKFMFASVIAFTVIGAGSAALADSASTTGGIVCQFASGSDTPSSCVFNPAGSGYTANTGTASKFGPTIPESIVAWIEAHPTDPSYEGASGATCRGTNCADNGLAFDVNCDADGCTASALDVAAVKPTATSSSNNVGTMMFWALGGMAVLFAAIMTLIGIRSWRTSRRETAATI